MLSSSGAIGLYGENAVAIGAKAKAQSSASVAIGANTVAIADTAGNFSSSSKRPITVIGTDAIIDGGSKGSSGSTAVGSNSLAGLLYRDNGGTAASFTDADYNTGSGGLTTTKNTAITHLYYTNDLFVLAGIDTTKTTIDVNEATAIGFDARALGDQSIAIGAQTVAGHSSVAIGGNDMNSVSTRAKKAYTDNVGKVFPINSISGFYPTTSALDGSVAIGREAKASGTQSISIGTANSVSGNYSGAVGNPSIIAGTGSYTVGNDNAVGATSTNVGAFGNNNQIGATATYDNNGKLQTTPGLVTTAAVDSSKAVGNNNYVNTSSTYVLGSGIGVKSDKSVMDTVANSVYLGDNSQVLATAGANMDVDGVAGSTTTGGATGFVSTATIKSTDAATTLTYGGFAGETAVGSVSVGAAGSERRIQNVAAGEISATSTDAINGSQLYVANQVTANVAGSVADIIGGDTTVNPDGTLAVTNIGDTGKTNVSDAIIAAKTIVISDNKTVAVRETTKDDGHTNYDLAVTKGSLTAGSNGTVTGLASPDVDGATTSNSFATVGDVANAINNSGFTLKTNKTGTGTNSATGSELINPGDNVTMIAGNNLDVAQSNGTVTYALQNDITLNSVTTGNTVMNNAGLTIGSDSNTTVINAGGITINQGAKGNPVSLTNSGLDNGGNKIINVSPGEADTDAVNVSQLKQMGNNVDLAIADVKDDIADTGANAAELSALKPLQYDPLEPTQIMAGIGGYKGSHALPVGVAHFKNESTMFHVGVTMGNHNTMYNAGVTWKFGNRDEEEAVPDRYKAGPISSVYVMQDEVSAIKV
ncbi:MAG: YadA-like family protein [Veillonella caviae]|uniref:YadA-like family protein n=1 Tax=Veillonella caviae TaxID=248316 RepID=UPI002A914E96|nr:YadA-like family protein [Veillonella caviae]MDY5481349.1 YadA-like family protein [Veillonella caviae]